jgi:photosystem II stability/assembly factor-like uncharacterized protein
MMTMSRRTILLFLLALIIVLRWDTLGQSKFLNSPALSSVSSGSSSLPNNSISHIQTRGATVFIGTSKGLARTIDGGASWESFRSLPQFANDGIFSVAVRGNTIWAATGFSKPSPTDPNASVQTGSGYTYSLDNGVTWTHRPQTLDAAGDSIVQYGGNRISFLPVTVPEQNVTFDVALTDSAVWIASWSSGLRKSTDFGQTWQRVVLPNDTRNSIAPSEDLTGYRVNPVPVDNFKVFAVYVENDSTVWAGSAGGINRSTDGGMSWAKFSTFNQVSHILGDWVIAINGQRMGATTRIWCTNWLGNTEAHPNQQYGVSYTDDGGRIWKNFLHGIKAYDFAFKDSTAYVATDEGIFRTADGGLSWTQSGTIIDQSNGFRITSKRFFSVGVVDDTVFCGGSDGLAKTVDNATNPFGQTWQVLRAFRPSGNVATTYAYPNPFSPKQEMARVHYSTGGRSAAVTVEVFDFGMNRVRTIIKDALRSGSSEHDEIWDGLDDARRLVANGVYFYRVTVEGNDPAWGKVMVLQ